MAKALRTFRNLLILSIIVGCGDSTLRNPTVTNRAGGDLTTQRTNESEQPDVTQDDSDVTDATSAEESADDELHYLSPKDLKPKYRSLRAALEAAGGDWAVALESMQIETALNKKGQVVRILDPNLEGHLNDEEFKLLAQIPTLRDIWLRDVKITDDGLRALEGMPQLTRLALEAPTITDEGLINLRYLTQLESLHIEDSKVTGAGLVHVASPEKIDWLVFSKSPIRDAALKLLPRFTNLTSLSLWQTPVTDDGIAALRDCHKLRNLDLCVTAVTDRGVATLVELPELERLSLFETGVTDACLPALLKMPKLKHVEFGVNQISVETFERLQLAHIEVDHGGLLNVHRESNLVRYDDCDFEVDTERSSLQASIHSDKPGVTYTLEIESTERYVASHMQPAHVNGPPMQFDKGWRQIVGEDFKVSYNDHDLHPISPDNPSNIYIGWHAATNHHHIQIKSRKGNRLLIDWHCDAAESDDGARLPVWVSAEIPFTQLTVSGEDLELADAIRLASQYFDTADFEKPEVVRTESETRVLFRLRPVAD